MHATGLGLYDVSYLCLAIKAALKKHELHTTDIPDLYALEYGKAISKSAAWEIVRAIERPVSYILKSRGISLALILCAEVPEFKKLAKPEQDHLREQLASYVSAIHYRRVEVKELAASRLRQQREEARKLRKEKQLPDAVWPKRGEHIPHQRLNLTRGEPRKKRIHEVTKASEAAQDQGKQCSCGSQAFIEYRSHTAGGCSAIQENPKPCNCPKKRACKACGKVNQ